MKKFGKIRVVSKIIRIFASEKIEETDEEIIIAGSSSLHGLWLGGGPDRYGGE